MIIEDNQDTISKSFTTEALIISFVLLSHIIIPLLKSELFPYSSFQLFTGKTLSYVEYEAFDNKRRAIRLRDIKLQRNYYGLSPREPYARIKPFTLNKFDQKLNPNELKVHILTYAKPEMLPLTIIQKVYGVKDEKVKLISTESILIQSSDNE
jgi:hypothetical protein